MKGFCRVFNVFLCSLFVFCLAMPVIASAEMVKKVDNFIIFMDQSGSMATAKAEPGNQKFDRAVKSIDLLDKVTPELGYTGGVATFAPYARVSSQDTYKTGSISSAASMIKPPFNTFTTMGDGLAAIGGEVAKLSGKTAVILYTDGASNQGSDPVTVAKSLYDKFSPNLCLHVVSYADTKEGEMIINDIKSLSDCSVVVDEKSLGTDAAMKQFAKAVLYDEVAPPPPPQPAAKPAPAPAPVAKEVVTFNLLFDFDKADIKDEMIPSLEQAKIILGEEPGTTFVVSGHTDSTGPEDYNQGLSERRAKAVKDWLVANGVSSTRLKTVGYGESRAKYDNSTREGRKLNRRVEMQSQ